MYFDGECNIFCNKRATIELDCLSSSNFSLLEDIYAISIPEKKAESKTEEKMIIQLFI
jgi:hypothetical protein